MCHRVQKIFSRIRKKTIDVQMIMIIIEPNRSRDRLGNPEALGRLPDYLLIRLITVFDPAFCRVFFFVPLKGLIRFDCLGRGVAFFRLMKRVDFAMARIIAKEK